MKKLAIAFLLGAAAIVSAACSTSSTTDTGKVVKSAAVGSLTVTLSNRDGVLKNRDNEFFVSFNDGSGNTVDVGAVGLSFYMPPMGTMPAMNNSATFTSTGSPGVYQGKVKFESGGDWQAQISYEGPAGKGKNSFPVTVQ